MNGFGCNRHLHLDATTGPFMAEMTKREGAVRILDAQASRSKLKGRIVAGATVIVVASLGVGVLTRWEFGLATLLMCGMLFQYAMERMNTLLEASEINGLKAMGWDADTELNEQTLEKIHNIANR
jgi:hypothetical protein